VIAALAPAPIRVPLSHASDALAGATPWATKQSRRDPAE
jgi:hypothetical protein